MGVNQLALLQKLGPLRRDIVSDGFDQALKLLGQDFPLKVHEYATGTPCWTWRVPAKWSCDEAFVETLAGERLIDQTWHPLQIASYSIALDQILTRDELSTHLHTHPHLPAHVPFIFHYYQKDWGFGCGHQVRDNLTQGRYRVVIRSRFEPGYLKVGELVLEGDTEDCFVLCGHLCHPGQVNDGLSGVVTGLAVMEELARLPRRRYTYRLLILPETIGSVAWLSHNESLIPRIKAGLFLDMTGVDLPPALQLSYFGNTSADACLRYIHQSSEEGAWTASYRGVVGNDERQFNAPGVRIPMLSYSRALPWGHPLRPYREYHSSADTLEITGVNRLNQSLQTVLAMVQAWDDNYYPVNRFKGEVFLAGYDLATDRHRNLDVHRNRLKIMDLIDGSHSSAHIAERLDISFYEVRGFLEQLRAAGLIEARMDRQFAGDREPAC
ncbi:MAG: DUF4910 domain-containing protein [Acidobacteriota bacterium]